MPLTFDGSTGFIDGIIFKPDNFLPGLSPSNPGTSAYQLQTLYSFGSPGRPGNGWYWIKPTATVPAILTYCDFTTEGGGWTMWRSYSYQRQGSLNRTNCNERVAQYQDGFDLFDAPYDWKVSIPLSTTNRQFLFYVSTSGAYDTFALNNFAVIAPTGSSTDFFQGSGAGVAIPCYGKIRGYSIYNTGYSGSYVANWWFNTSSYEAHTDSSGIPGAASSEDNFGYYGTINNTAWPVNGYTVKFVR